MGGRGEVDVLPGLKAGASTPPDGSAVAPQGPPPFLPALKDGVSRRISMKNDTLAKVRKQLAGISALIDFWWQTVHQDLAQMAMTPEWTQWTDELLLPLMYW